MLVGVDYLDQIEQRPEVQTLHKIRVFVVRHGEREDEVCSRMAYNKMSREQRLDPALTAQGHSQAMQAFTNLIRSFVAPPHPKSHTSFEKWQSFLHHFDEPLELR